MKIKSTELLRSSQSWDGANLPDYPSGKPEMVVNRMVFPVGAKTGWHHHNVINYGIVEQGELTIVCADGSQHTFRRGEALIEVVGTIHRGENRGNEPVILNMFYVSTPGQEITVQHPDFVMKDHKGRIHLFEVKSVNRTAGSNIDSSEYEDKVRQLKACYLACSKKLDGYIFYLPLLKDDTWQITRFCNGVEDMLSEESFRESLE